MTDDIDIPRTIIMLSGWMQSGKDTVGNYLCHAFGFHRFAFADVLKDEVSELFHISRQSLDTSEGKAAIFNQNTGQTVRDLLISHGQARRAENINYWVERVIKSIESKENDPDTKLKQPFHRIVITDWRFTNEYSFLMHHFSINDNDPTSHIYTWRINRWNTPPLNDPTETNLDTFSFNHVIQNLGSIDSLYSLIRDIIYNLHDYNIRILLTDVDEVLLQWMVEFKQFLINNKYSTVSSFPSTWALHDWILHDGSPLTENETRKLILQFNHSDQFQSLKPYDHAKETLSFLKEFGFHIVAISSCTDDHDVFTKRKFNLDTNFPGLIDNLICLPLGSPKIDVLTKFPQSIWIDDNIHNVQDGIKLNHFSFLMKRPWNNEPDDDIPFFSSWIDIKNFVLFEETLHKLFSSIMTVR